jgi:hypothetical protein
MQSQDGTNVIVTGRRALVVAARRILTTGLAAPGQSEFYFVPI